MKTGRKKGTPKTGGRQKGTPNKIRDEVRELIESTLGASPFERMARLAQELLDGTRTLVVPAMVRENGESHAITEESDAKAIEVATKLLTELAQYCAPKRKAVELSGPGGGPIEANGLVVEVVNSRDASGQK